MTEITEYCPALPHIPAEPFRAAFLHDWQDVTMIHFAVEPEALQPSVPFELDTYAGKAYITLVFFTLNRMRIPGCPGIENLSRNILRPISDHRFLNLRTYVRHRGEPGIHFIAEWLENRLAVCLGPACYSLPYHYGAFNDKQVTGRAGSLACDTTPTHAPYRISAADSLDAFLLERYAAFNQHKQTARVFRIRHEPWRQRPVAVTLTESGLLTQTLPCLKGIRPCCAHQCQGLTGVRVSRPRRITTTL